MQKLIWQNSKGEEINLTSGHYGITNWQGFSEVSSNVQSQTVPFQDGSVYLDALLDERELSVTLAIQDNNDLELRYQLRRELIHALNPKLGEGYLIYTNDFISKRIKCVANVPVFENHNSNDTGTPKASLTWTACEPYWEDLEETKINLTLGIKTLENNGDVPVNCKFYIQSNDADNVQVKNNTNKEMIEYKEQNINEIEINTNFGMKTVRKNFINYSKVKFSANFISIAYNNSEDEYVLGSMDSRTIRTKDFVNFEQSEQIYIDDTVSSTMIAKIKYISRLHLYIAITRSYPINQNTNSAIITSSDGLNWTIRQKASGNTGWFMDIAFNDNIIVAVNDNGYVYKSSDGITWTGQSFNTNLYCVCFNTHLNQWVVGGKEIILYSSNGTSWTTINLPQFTKLNGVTFNDSYYLGFGAGWSEDLQTYTQCLYRSLDGLNWEIVNDLYNTYLPTTSIEMYWFEKENVFVIITDNYYIHLVNPITYKYIQNISINEHAYQILYKEDIGYIGVYDYFRIFTSSNLIKWFSLTERLDSYNYYSVYYDKVLNLYFLLSFGIYKVSSDGENWENKTALSATSNYNQMIRFKEKLYMVLYWRYIAKSSNGLSWESSYDTGSNYDGYFTSIACSSDEIVVVTEDGKCYKSSDGVNWTNNVISENPLRKVIYYKNNFFAIGDNGTILRSSDGENWTSLISGTNENLNDIAFNENQLVIVGSNGIILLSTNMNSWQIVNSGVTSSLNGIYYYDDKLLFIITGSGGLILESFNAVNWNVNTNIETTSNLNGITNTSKGLLVCGGTGSYGYAFDSKENKIQNISENSNMNFKLDVGQNILQIMGNGDISCNLSYRQKYIGV